MRDWCGVWPVVEAAGVLSPLGCHRARGTFLGPACASVSPPHFLLAGRFALLLAPELSQGKEMEPLATFTSFLFVQLGIVAGDTGAKECHGSLWLRVAQCRHLETYSLRILSRFSSLLTYTPGKILATVVQGCVHSHFRIPLPSLRLECLLKGKNPKSSHYVRY